MELIRRLSSEGHEIQLIPQTVQTELMRAKEKNDEYSRLFHTEIKHALFITENKPEGCYAVTEIIDTYINRTRTSTTCRAVLPDNNDIKLQVINDGDVCKYDTAPLRSESTCAQCWCKTAGMLHTYLKLKGK